MMPITKKEEERVRSFLFVSWFLQAKMAQLGLVDFDYFSSLDAVLLGFVVLLNLSIAQCLNL